MGDLTYYIRVILTYRQIRTKKAPLCKGGSAKRWGIVGILFRFRRKSNYIQHFLRQSLSQPFG